VTRGKFRLEQVLFEGQLLQELVGVYVLCSGQANRLSTAPATTGCQTQAREACNDK